MGLKPVVISSATSSQYGANHPEMMWPDMEKLLFDNGLIQTRSIATSIGGVGDRGVGMANDVLEGLLEVIDRNDVPLLRESRSLIQFANACNCSTKPQRANRTKLTSMSAVERLRSVAPKEMQSWAME